MRKCINCNWEGEENLNANFNCPVCGDDTLSVETSSKPEPKTKDKPKPDLDINNDGKVDDKDYKEMASALGKRGGRPKSKKR